MGTQAKARKQVRSFVLIWILVTLMMGACTFAAIYAAYGVVIEGEIGDTVASNEAADVVQVDNALATQAFPTRSSVAMASGQQSASVDQNADQVGRASVDAQAAANDGGDSDDNGEVVAVQPTAAEPTVASQPTEEDPFAGAADALREAAEQQAQSAPTNPPPTEPPPPTTEPTPLPVNVTDFQLGIQVQAAFDADMGLWMGEVDKLGMDWVKIQVRWENIEEVQGEYNWAAVDNAVNAAAERDIKVLASVVTAPDWAREPGVDLSQHGPPADYQVFADFRRDAVATASGQDSRGRSVERAEPGPRVDIG